MSKKIEGLYTARDLWDSVKELHSGNTAQPFDVGFQPLDDLYKVARGTFHVWTGVPNHGKSSFLSDVIMNMAKIHGWKFVIFSPEHSMSNNIKRLCEKFMMKPFDYGMSERITNDELIKSLAFIQEHFFFIDMENESPDIDPYNEINPKRAGNLREDEHISTVISDIKRFNRETECVTWLVAHPKKLQRESDGSYRVDGYDISGSAHFSNKADIIVVIERMFELEQTRFHVRKVREADYYGAIGTADFKWNGKTRCFHALSSNVWK